MMFYLRLSISNAFSKYGLTFASFLIVFGCGSGVFGQRGPGGVSLETTGPTQSTCRLWLDAGSLTNLADGDDVAAWTDESLSAEIETALPGIIPPYFRDDPAFAINGYPVITFEDGRYLAMGSANDLNLNAITTSKSIFFAFRTSDDVTTKQVIYEEGGGDRGFNVIIHNEFIIIGAYDDKVDADGTPKWGYSYITYPIVKNTTNILALQYFVASTGTVQNNSNYFLQATLNGQLFNTLVIEPDSDTDNTYTNTGLGSLFRHPDPIGIGGLNSDMVDRDATYSGQSGSFPFRGQLGEICYYNDFLSETERIIIENYLGAKYLADLVTNDKYIYQASYGGEVIGIGRETLGDLHNLSRGRNPFLIQATNPPNSPADNLYFFTGHNRGNMVYTTTNVPNNSINIQRLDRIWRADRLGNIGNIQFTINSNDLPPAPAGYSKLVMLIDATNATFPNFSLPSTLVFEMENTSGSIYSYTSSVTDNDFYTFGWARPEVNFSRDNCFTIEGDPMLPSPPNPPTFTNVGASNTTQVTLNYRPHPSSGSTVIDYAFIEVTALRGFDFEYNSTTQAGGLTIPAGLQTAFIPVQRVNDDIAESPAAELFQVVLMAAANTTTGLIIGPRDTLDFNIYDDDPTPKVTFATPSSITFEPSTASATFNVQVVRSGDNSGTDMLNVIVDFGNTTANDIAILPDMDDFDFSGPFTVTFLPMETTKNVPVTIRGDNANPIYEGPETITLRLIPITTGTDPSAFVEHVITIQDTDDPPIASFVALNQSGFETNGSPVITVTLDIYSALDVIVDFEINTALFGPGYATYNVDYTGSPNGVIEFQPFDREGFLGPLNIVSAIPNEDDEIIEFTLTSATNAVIGSGIDDIPTATYTIIDYAPFENRGAAGVGRNTDNIVWIDPDRMSGTGAQAALTNFSPQPITINRYSGTNNQANLSVSTALNNRKTLTFDGVSGSSADVYTMTTSPKINAAGFVERLAYFFVIRPSSVPTGSAANSSAPTNTQCKLIYEQGGGTRGTSIYLYNNKLYFHAWNDNNDGDQSPWGYANGLSNPTLRVGASVWASSTQNILPNTNYVVSCHYDNNSNEPLMVYVNGVKGEMSSTILSNPSGSVGKLYGHTGAIGLGSMNTDGRFHFTTSTGTNQSNSYQGILGDFIIFHDHQLNETRRVIIENYLSAKYNIGLDNVNTPQIFDLTFANRNNASVQDFNNEIAGVGLLSLLDAHGDAQGPDAVLRVKDPSVSSQGYLVWGSNGRDLTNTYPWSYNNGQLPPGIEERSGQVWKVFEFPSNGVANTDFYINISASANASTLDNTTGPGSLLKLLTHTNPDPDDFSGPSVMVYNVNTFGSGPVARFENIPVTPGMYVALGNTNPISNQNGVLPIELLFFRAQLAGETVQLNWATSSEINNELFIVERAGGDLIWEPILQQPGAGFSTQQLNYNDVDREPLTGISYYRLKQIDFDGAFAYSDVVSVINNSGSDSESFLYPNPTNLGKVFIQLSEKMIDTNLTLELHDMAGKLLQQENYPNCPSVIDASLEGLGKGIYVIKLRCAQQSQSLKVVVQ